jgi:hypothetical protein
MLRYGTERYGTLENSDKNGLPTVSLTFKKHTGKKHNHLLNTNYYLKCLKTAYNELGIKNGEV